MAVRVVEFGGTPVPVDEDEPARATEKKLGRGVMGTARAIGQVKDRCVPRRPTIAFTWNITKPTKPSGDSKRNVVMMVS